MGIMDRLRNWRQEDVKRDWFPTSDLTDTQTFVADLIANDYTNRDDPNHQLAVAMQDAMANYITIKLAIGTFDDWFRFVKKIGDEEEIMLDVQKDLRALNAKRWFTEALIAERVFGIGRLYTGPNKYRLDYQNGKQLASLDVFTPLNSSIPDDQYDNMGRPKVVRVKYNPKLQSLHHDLPAADFVLWMTRPKGRSYEGYSALYPVWDDLTYTRMSKHALAWAHMKYGLGIYMWAIKGGQMTDETEAALESAVEDSGVMRAFLYDEGVVSSVEFVGPTGSSTNNIVEGINSYLGFIAAGSGVPGDVLRGTASGERAGGEVLVKALYATINQIQKNVEPYLREVVRRMGHVDEEYEIDWNLGYPIDEVEAANARLLNANAEMLEKQAESGMGMNDIAIRDQTRPEEDNLAGEQG